MGEPQQAGARVALLMDSAYEDSATRALVQQHGLVPVVPPNSRRHQPWLLDRAVVVDAMRSSACSDA